MKPKIIIIIILVTIFATSYSQLILEGSFNDRFKTIQLDNGEIRYLKYDREEQYIYIHNLDQTVWKKVRIPLPEEHLLDEIKSVTQTTLNKDTLVELIYSCVEYKKNETGESIALGSIEVQFTLNIINENGEMILKVPESNEIELVGNNGNRKLLIYKHIGKGMLNRGQTLVYSLPE